MEKLLTQAEAAELLAVQPASLEKWRWAGEGPRYHKVGRLVRYSLEDLERWLAGRAVSSTSDHPGIGA